MKKIVPITLIIIFLDQIIKWVISSQITYGETIPIIGHFFSFTNVHNEGGAWSILAGNRLFLIFVSVFALALIYVFFIRGKKLKLYEIIGYGLLSGGIIGNLIDRIFHGYVIDYLEVHFGSYIFPIFNLADCCIVISVILLLIFIFKEEIYARNHRA